jgi:hypothetical protein
MSGQRRRALVGSSTAPGGHHTMRVAAGELDLATKLKLMRLQVGFSAKDAFSVDPVDDATAAARQLSKRSSRFSTAPSARASDDGEEGAGPAGPSVPPVAELPERFTPVRMACGRAGCARLT